MFTEPPLSDIAVKDTVTSQGSRSVARRALAGTRAPVVAVVGPANSGKTSFLHLLDEALQLHSDAPLVYVVKGSPDGTGRYLFHAPELRERLKPRVKGSWAAVTAETISKWIERCCRHLELVLVDVGGKHSASNTVLFRHCSHFLVVAKALDDEAAEREEGMESWVRAGRRAGLELLGRVRSLWREGQAGIGTGDGGALDATFRADAAEPGNAANHEVIEKLVDELLALRLRREPPSYVDLRLHRDWSVSDLADLAGMAPVIERKAEQVDVVLGGRAPIWAYAATLYRILQRRPSAEVTVFDPKAPSGLVTVPETLSGEVSPEVTHCLSARWRPGPGGRRAVLELAITTADHFLPPDFTEHLPALPRPEGLPSAGPVVISGAGPIWLHLAYSRWLRPLSRERRIGHVDARMQSAIFVAGPGAPSAEPWALG